MSLKFKVPIEIDGQVSAEYIDLSTTTTHTVNAGEIAWNSVDGTFDIGLLNGVTLQAGQEMHFYGKATEAISNGNAVMFAGVQGDHILIAKADAVTINANPEYFMGVATQDFATNDFGYVTVFGNVRGLNTSSYTLGDILYYNSASTTDGLLTTTEPSAPNAKIIVAAVVRVHATQGILAVRPHTMPKLKDIQDVNVDTATTGEILQLQSDGVWENKTLSEAGIISGSGTTNYVSKFTGTTSLGNSIIFDNGTNVGIGTTSPTTRFQIGELFKVTSDAVTTWGSTNSMGTLSWDANLAIIGGLANTAVQFRANNAEVMRLTTSGNVGIGTSSPTQKLQVNGSLLSTSTLNSTSGSFLIDHPGVNSWKIGITNANTSTFSIGNDNGGAFATKVFNITNSGNVGIGTTSPTQTLDVNGNFSSNNIFLKATNSLVGTNTTDGSDNKSLRLSSSNDVSVSRGSYINLYGNENSNTGKLQLLAGNVSDGNIEFYTGNVIERMRITSSGNVGIGTSSPGNKLQISAADSSNQLLRLGVSYDTSRNLRGGINWYDGSNTTGQISTEYDGTMVSMVFGSLYNSGYNSNQLMIIRGNGNVGIGTTSPSYRTQIETTGADVFLTKNTSSTSFNRSYFYNNNNVGIQFLNFGSAYGFGTEFGVGQNGSVIQSNTTSAFAVGTSGAYPLLLGTSGTERMRITSAGNVGIGTTTPSVKLVADGGSSSFTPIWAKSSFLASSKYYASLYAGYALATNQLTQFGYVYDTITPANSFAHITPYGSTEGSKFMVRADGNVGIGTSNPEVSLDVVGISGGTAQSRVRSTSGGDIRISVDTVGRLGTYSASSLLLLTSGTERMRIDTSGNVGIGTSSPSGKLDVIGNLYTSSEFRIGASYAATGTGLIKSNSGVLSLFTWGDSTNIQIGGSDVIFKPEAGSERMRITSAGNVGIGTSSPSTKLQVNGDISSVMTGPAGNTGMYKFGDGSTFMLGGTTSPFVSFELGYSEKMRIEGSTDNIGIGTSTPNSSAKLDVSSTTKGFLPPRMNDTEMNSISSPAQGLMIFNTSVNAVCVYDGSTWKRLAYA